MSETNPDTQQAAPPPAIVFSLGEAQALVECFGGEDGEFTVRRLPAGAITDDPADPVAEGPSPAGLWAHMTEYPEEGCMYLGPNSVDASLPTADQPPQLRAITEQSCGGCDYDEAEGGLFNHCDKCCRKIATEAYALAHPTADQQTPLRDEQPKSIDLG